MSKYYLSKQFLEKARLTFTYLTGESLQDTMAKWLCEEVSMPLYLYG